MRLHRPVALLLLCLVLAGCGANTPAPTPLGAPTATGTPSAVSARPPAPPAVRPPGLVLVARAGDVLKTIDGVERWLKVPGITKSLDLGGTPIVDLLQPGASIDVAVALAPSGDDDLKLYWAFSVPLRNSDEVVAAAKSDGADVAASPHGGYHLEENDLQCDLLPGAADAPARAVCSEGVDDVAKLGDWMVRGLAAEPRPSADVWARAELGALKERYLPMLRAKAKSTLDDARGAMGVFLDATDPELLDAPGAALEELFRFAEDTRAVELSLRFDDAQPELRFSTSLELRDTTSWVSKVLAQVFDPQAPPPDLFFRLPNDATTAYWSPSADPALFTGIRSSAHKLAAALFASRLASRFMTKADGRALLAWLDGIPSFAWTWVGGRGTLPPAACPDTNLTPEKAIDCAKETVRKFLGWGVWAGEGNPGPAVAWLKTNEDVVRRGEAILRKFAGKDAKDLGWLPRPTFRSNAPGFPKGTSLLELQSSFSSKDAWAFTHQDHDHPKGREAHGQITLTLAVVPLDATHYAWGYAADAEALKRHLDVVMKGGPAASTLGARSDLDLLKAHRGFGGYMTLRSFFDALDLSGDLSPSGKRMTNALVAALPHHGDGPLFFLGGSTGGTAPKLTYEMVAGRDLLDDVAAAVRFAMASSATSASGVKP